MTMTASLRLPPVPHVTYSDMAECHGHEKAMGVLKAMERLAAVSGNVVPLDRNVRFERAFQALCALQFSEGDY